MTDHPPNGEALRNVIGAAICRRATREDGDRTDQETSDCEEFLDDADAVLAALVAGGYSVPAPLPVTDPDESTARAIDTLARESASRVVLATGAVHWEDYPGIGEQDRESVVRRITERAASDRPDPTVLLDAYEYLAARAEVGQSRAS